jgi:hypothetical protein
MPLWSLIYSFTFHFQTNYRMSAPICALLRSIGQECGGPPDAAAVAREEGGSLPSWLLLGCGLGAAVVAGLAITAAAYFACRRRATPPVGWPRLNDSRGLPLLELTLPRWVGRSGLWSFNLKSSRLNTSSSSEASVSAQDLTRIR